VSVTRHQIFIARRITPKPARAAVLPPSPLDHRRFRYNARPMALLSGLGPPP